MEITGLLEFTEVSNEGGFRNFGLQSTAGWMEPDCGSYWAGLSWLRLHLVCMMRYPVYGMRHYNDFY